MGRTLPSFIQVILAEQASLIKFRRALRQEDREVFDDLFCMAHTHSAESAYAPHALPFEVMLLVMLLEEHKLVLRLHEKIGYLENGSEGN
jgi:hypothetical protein